MEISSSYTQIQSDTTVLRKGGITLKGTSRTTRQPVHLILLVDTSGSMEENNKLGSVQRSLTLLLQLLSPDDRISLVTFSDDSTTILRVVTPTSEERQAIQYRIQKLTPEGSTNMSAGLLEARALVEPPTSGRKQGLILLTDGHANIGVYSEQGLIEILTRIQSESPGLSLTTVGYGVDHNAEMLTNLAKAGGGAYNVVNTLEDVATVFGDILGGLVSVSAQKVEIQFPPGSQAFTSFRFLTDAAGLTTVYVGDLYSDAEITVLFSSAPALGPLRVKGTDMTTLDPLDRILEPTLLIDGTQIPLSLRIADYRQQVVTLLKELPTLHGSTSSFREDCEALIRKLQEDDTIRDHPLKAILIEDLQQALTLAQRGHLSQMDTVEMAQHSAYLGMARGLRSQTTQVPRGHSPGRRRGLRRQMAVGSRPPSPERVGTPPPPPMMSPFANRIQTQLASVMHAMSTQEPEESP
jgi:Mg-chelatase subunit ChlD